MSRRQDVENQERLLMAAGMMRPDLLMTAVRGDDFESELGAAWSAAQVAHSRGEPVDPVTLGSAMGGHWLSTLSDLYRDMSHLSASGEHAARVVKEAGLERRAGALAQAFADGELDRDAMIDGIRALESERDLPAVTAYSALKDLIDQLDTPPEAMATGIQRFDNFYSGLHRGDMISLLARPAIGKTAMAVSIARHMAGTGRKVLFYSGEMPSTQILARMIAQQADIPAYKFRSGNLSETQWAEFNRAAVDMKDYPLFFSDPSMPTLTDLQGLARRIHMTEGLDVVFIDYIQRLQSPRKESFRHEMMHTAKSLKAMARELDVCVVALAQAGRHVDQYEEAAWGKLPQMGDAGESSQIEMESDMVLSLARKDNVGCLGVMKNRHGPCGLVALDFEGKTMRFSSDVPKGPTVGGNG